MNCSNIPTALRGFNYFNQNRRSESSNRLNSAVEWSIKTLSDVGTVFDSYHALKESIVKAGEHYPLNMDGQVGKVFHFKKLDGPCPLLVFVTSLPIQVGFVDSGWFLQNFGDRQAEFIRLMDDHPNPVLILNKDSTVEDIMEIFLSYRIDEFKASIEGKENKATARGFSAEPNDTPEKEPTAEEQEPLNKLLKENDRVRMGQKLITNMKDAVKGLTHNLEESIPLFAKRLMEKQIYQCLSGQYGAIPFTIESNHCDFANQFQNTLQTHYVLVEKWQHQSPRNPQNGCLKEFQEQNLKELSEVYMPKTECRFHRVAFVGINESSDIFQISGKLLDLILRTAFEILSKLVNPEIDQDEIRWRIVYVCMEKTQKSILEKIYKACEEKEKA